LKNGVDTEFFNAQNTDNQLFSIKNKPKKTLSFVANMGYFPNIVASEFLVNQIYKNLDPKEFEILLAGSRPSQKVKNLASANVKVSGWIDDIRDAYLQSDILVAPIFTGSGQQNKILEALAMQVPVITTLQVANGINASENELMIANTASEFQACIKKLASDDALYKQLQKNGRAFVQNHFSWNAATKPLVDLLNQKPTTNS
jgi:glycosyltransferase involved in cell wall biosynthesis